MAVSRDFIFDQESLTRIAALRGQRWKCFGSPSMTDQLAAPFNVFFLTETVAITVTSAVEYFDIDGEPYHTTIAELSVAQGAAEFEQAVESGHAYLFHAGEEVADVIVIRDGIAERRNGLHTWSIVKDVGLVFVLSSGVVGISQLGLHDEMLQVTMGESIGGLKLPAIQRKWGSGRGTDYAVSRRFVTVGELPTGRRAPADG